MTTENLNQTATKPNKVVLLGANGFIGSNLKTLIEGKGWDVVGITSKDIDLTNDGSVTKLKETIKADDTVVMLSCLTPDRGRDYKTFMKNLQMAGNVTAWLEDAQPAHFVYINSDAIYENGSSISEESPAISQDLYAAMHIAREVMLKTTCGQKQVPFLSLRPNPVYGRGDTHNSYGPNRFLAQIKADKQVKLFGEGEETRNHIYIKDIVELMALSLEHKTVGELNLASDASISFMDVCKKMKEHLDFEIITSDRQNAVTHRHYDISRIYKLFPSFKFTPIDEGLKEICS